jgi:hypothetical protein
MRQGQAMRQNGAASGLTFPIKLRCTSLADLIGEPELEVALTRALGKGFAKARSALPSALSTGGGVALKAPQLVDGSGLGDAQATALLIRVQRAIEAAARAQSLQRAQPRLPRVDQRSSRQPAEDAPAKDVGERLDPARFDADTASYDVPSYQNAGAPTPLPVQKAPTPTLSVSEILDRLDHGDKQLLDDMFESTPYADVLSVLTEFEKRSPKKFLAMLRDKIKADAARITSFERNETQLTFHANTTRLLDSNAKLIRLLKEIPSARVLLREQTQKDADFARLVGLVDALCQVYEQLIAYLKTRKDRDSSFFADVYTRQVADTLPRIAGIFLLGTGAPGGKNILRDVIKDVGEHVRWVLAVIDKIKEIDGWIDLYQLLFGASADQTEEVATLVEARGKYLGAIWDNVIPTTARIAAVSKDLDAFYADWQGHAGDKKLEKINKGLAEAKSLFLKTPFSGDFGGGISRLDHVYNGKRDLVGTAIRDAEKDAEKEAHSPNRDAEHLTRFSAIEAKVPEIIVRLQLLHLWFATLYIGHQVGHYNIGDDSDRTDWFDDLEAIRHGIEAQFDHPDYAALNGKYQNWQKSLDRVQADIQTAARHEFYITLGIAIFATIVTAGAFAGAGISVAVVLAEAGTFTLINTIGQAALLGKPIDPGDVITDFAENAVMFGAFKGLNIVAAAGAKAILPGKMLAQLGVVFTTTTVVTTGVPALLNLIQGKEMSEETKISLVVNLVVNAAMTLVGGLKTRNQIRELQEVNLAARTQLIQDLESQSNASAEILKELDEFIKSPNLKPEKFEDLKQRSSDVLPKFEKSLNRLAGPEFSDAALAKLGLTRAMIQDMAKSTADAARLIAGASYAPAPKASALPAPGKVVAGLVQTSETTFEYNPSEKGKTAPGVVAAELKGAGYGVEDEGGGVLKVTAPKADRPILLLPAGEPGAAEFQRGLFERAIGYHNEAETAAIKADLERIYRDLPKLLQVEFADETALSTLELLVEQRAKLPDRWPVASVRGLAEMLKLERGITRPAIRKLFEALPPDELASLFGKYNDIVNNSRIRPGANLLVSEEMTPKNSAKLIEAYDKIRLARLTLPENMTPKAIQGLLRWIRDGSDYVAKLKDIEQIDKRVAQLEADSPIRVPGEVPKVPSINENTLAKHTKPLRPGLNLFEGEPAEVARQVEALGKNKGGKFSDDAERKAFADTIAHYRKMLRSLQAGKMTASNLAGDRREIEQVIAGLETGTEVFASGNKIRLNIDPALFKLPRDFTVTNAAQKPVQLDFGGRTTDGVIVIDEVSTSELKLPDEMRKLLPPPTNPGDPPGGEPDGGTIDFEAVKTRESAKTDPVHEASGRKFQQMIKLRAAALFAREFIAGFAALSGETTSIALPDLVVSVSKADPEAVKVAAMLGIRVVQTGKK